MKKKILLVFGTRPEAIKMAPVSMELAKFKRDFDCRIAVTGQHRGLLAPVLRFFRIKPHHDLDVMRSEQTLTDVSTRVLKRLEPVLKKERPDLVLVHGDTTTACMAALAAFYQHIPVGHVEAGLRSGNSEHPFPEEMNRRLTDEIAVLHFAPTCGAKMNLLREGIPSEGIVVTGNTGIDALHQGSLIIQTHPPRCPAAVRAAIRSPFLLMTTHRRENFGQPLENIFLAVRALARDRPRLRFVFPVHPNRHVLSPARRILGQEPNILLTHPLDYGLLLLLMRQCLLVLTDSGGIQEEAPSLGKPVLVFRDVTERPEAVRAGTVCLVGTEPKKIKKCVEGLLDDAFKYRRMARAVNPYGDGLAARRTVAFLRYWCGQGPRPLDFQPGANLRK